MNKVLYLRMNILGLIFSSFRLKKVKNGCYIFIGKTLANTVTVTIHIIPRDGIKSGETAMQRGTVVDRHIDIRT